MPTPGTIVNGVADAPGATASAETQSSIAKTLRTMVGRYRIISAATRDLRPRQRWPRERVRCREHGSVDAQPPEPSLDLDHASIAGAEAARHRRLPRELRPGLQPAHRLEHRLGAAGEHVEPGGHRLGDVRRLEHDLGIWYERRGFCVPRAAEAKHRVRFAEPLREIRKWRDADAAADEQRVVDAAEAVSQRADHGDRVARPR